MNFLSCVAEEQTLQCTSSPRVHLPALLGCKEQICVQPLPERVYFIGELLPLLTKTSVSHSKGLVVLPQASFVSPPPQLNRPMPTLQDPPGNARHTKATVNLCTSVPHLPATF